MQTFLPYPSFAMSAQCLDNTRLNNQINEALIVWRTLTGYYALGKGWPNHTTTRMWRGYEDALAEYHDICLSTYSMRPRQSVEFRQFLIGTAPCVMPPWLGNKALHASHRSNLLRKDPEWYSQFGWQESPDLPYVWPA